MLPACGPGLWMLVLPPVPCQASLPGRTQVERELRKKGGSAPATLQLSKGVDVGKLGGEEAGGQQQADGARPCT